MSGHSKWANIRFRKEIADKRKGKIFTKLAQQITVAAKEGSEIKLKLAIEKAKQANLPSENIERAIKRGRGELGGAKLEEVTYEAIGPEGIAILISATTDNKNRTSQEVRNVLEKNGAKMAGAGSVRWMFEQKGIIRIDAKSQDKEELELLAIDAGADDVREEEDEILVYTKPENLESVKKNLETEKLSITNYEISVEPKNSVKINNLETAKKILKLMDEIDNLDEVTSVSSNFDIPEEIIKNIENSKS